MLTETYEQIKILKSGEQSNSEVVKIKDISTKKHYVMKIIKGINTPLYNVLFEREVGALTKLRTCKHIVRLENFDTYNDKKYGKCGRVFLEYIEGETLKNIDVMDLNNPQKFNIIQQLINAVQVAHENSIIHRDINPKNIMITQDYQVKLIDFGISKIKDMVNTDTTYQFATNIYAAPEVHKHSENATEKSDIYSLGVVLYYLFTGGEPPNSEYIESDIYKTGGIDIELKEIIVKMVKNNPKDRYENIFDVKKSLLKLFGRYSKTNKTFVFSLSTGKIDHMRNLSLIPKNGKYDEIVSNIYEEFLESYIAVENENTNEEKFYLYGQHYYFLCLYDDRKQIFDVAKVFKLQPFKKEQIKKKAMFVNGDVRIVLSGNNTPGKNNNFELTINSRDQKKEYLSSLNVNNEYSKNFFAWHKLLEIIEDEYKRNVLRFNYYSVKVENNYCIFSIQEEDYHNLEENKNEEIMFIYENGDGKKISIIEIGFLNKFYTVKGRFYLKIKLSTNKIRLPRKGVICEDYRRNLSLISREMKALKSFNNEDYASPSNLKSIFSGIETSSYFNAPDSLSFFNKNLDAAQKRAVTKALNSQDISLIQGPPGTGKTNVIIEILRQILNKNKNGQIFKQNILLVSQAHAAVDKMLEDLDEYSDDHNKVIRIGRDENLSEIVRKKYSVDYAQSKWVKKIINNSNSFAKRLLDSMDINIGDFDRYCEAFSELKFSKEKESDFNKEAKSFVNYFEKKYRDHLLKKDFKSLMIQREWVSRIVGRMDIQQHFIKNAVIVSGTCTGVVSNYIIKDMVFDFVIIDEAAKATFPELLVSIIRAKKIIMVGDHKQLPPILDDKLIMNSKQAFDESKLDYKTLYDSIFMKLFNHLPKENKQILNTQYRMHPAIGTMISQLFYENHISNGVPIAKRIHNIELYKGKAIVWIDTSSSPERAEEKILKTYTNLLEANIVKEQLKTINNNLNGETCDVGVITPYSGQKNLIRNEIQQTVYENIHGNVVVNSVDAFQGGQKDIIIYSTVRSSNDHKKIGFLKSEERLNVAFSRAKKLLIIVGDAKFLSEITIEENKFPQIIKYIKENEKYCEIIDYISMQKHRIGEAK
ncbi:protein kinase [Ornithinibacillus sp. L9]|uniref:Protein kinase n=1 Tax=Ornithinibacillus caprae TaxID=2678566 RepID=A0A6N8FIQ5_9BACI|nr:serine/threonine-protein kinase [Ornithinibacillus caprae]MUK89313.1 protein kinase [Ornithinibacillus caprae]